MMLRSTFKSGVRTLSAANTVMAASASTLAPGRAALLEKRPDDVVIAFAARTAMGRAKKGQLKDVPVDELLTGLFKVETLFLRTSLCAHYRTQATLNKTGLDPGKIEDICVGTSRLTLGVHL